MQSGGFAIVCSILGLVSNAHGQMQQVDPGDLVWAYVSHSTNPRRPESSIGCDIATLEQGKLDEISMW